MNEVAKKNADEIKKLPPRKIWENHYLSMYEFDCCRRCHDFHFRWPKKVYRLSLLIKSISLVFYLGVLGILLQRNSEPYQ